LQQLGVPLSGDEVPTFCEGSDLNGNGMISLDGFRLALTTNSSVNELADQSSLDMLTARSPSRQNSEGQPLPAGLPPSINSAIPASRVEAAICIQKMARAHAARRELAHRKNKKKRTSKIAASRASISQAGLALQKKNKVSTAKIAASRASISHAGLGLRKNNKVAAEIDDSAEMPKTKWGHVKKGVVKPKGKWSFASFSFFFMDRRKKGGS